MKYELKIKSEDLNMDDADFIESVIDLLVLKFRIEDKHVGTFAYIENSDIDLPDEIDYDDLVEAGIQVT